ncbi:MAG: GDP-mannose 4,6-dehydratase, partial [Chloroflexota bacterium]|nr:GDP-mannose 4,6-dehydratase [Chloroflexota bacterium]
TVEGFIKAAQTPDVIGETFNLGYGEEVSIGELAEMIIELVGRPVKIIVDQERIRPEKSEVMRLLSDNSKANKLLGWRPEIGFHEGLSRTIEWIRGHLDLYRVGEYER